MTQSVLSVVPDTQPCPRCGGELGSDPIVIKFVDYGTRRAEKICKSCNEQGVREFEEHTERDRLDMLPKLEELRARMLTSFPRGVGCSCDDRNFAQYVKREPYREFAREYDGSISALLCGPTGLGKSSAIRAAAIRLVHERTSLERTLDRPTPIHLFGRVSWNTQSRISVMFAKAQQLINARRQHDFGKGECELVRFAKSTEVLFLDEMAQVRDLDQVCKETIDERYSEGRVTVATSGLTYRDFCAHWGVDVGRRLTEAGRGCLIEVAK